MTLGTLLVLIAATQAQAYPAPGRTQRISLTAAGAQADERSVWAVLSADGGTVAFWSYAGLVPEDTNGIQDVYVRDLRTGAVERVSVASNGAQATTYTPTLKTQPTLSADGRLVAFENGSAELVPGDTNLVDDIFVHDRATGQTTRVSVSVGGAQAAWHSQNPALSADGRYIFFMSEDDTLVSGDQSPYIDIFRRDLQTGAVELVSLSSQGQQSVFDPSAFAINASGTLVAWASISPSHQVPDTTGPISDIYVRDLTTGVTTRISDAPNGLPADGSSVYPVLSADGRYVAFGSLADNLVPDDRNGVVDVFVHDRVTHRTEKVSVNSAGAQSSMGAGTPAISADGRFVAFNGISQDLADNPDGNTGTDIYVHDMRTGETQAASLIDGGTSTGDTISISPSLSGDGRLVAFSSESTDLVAGDTNETGDTFLRDRGPVIGVGTLQASTSGGSTSVSGWARFGGSVSEGTDPVGDGSVQVGVLGGDLIGARAAWRPERDDLFFRTDLDLTPHVPRTGTVVGLQGVHHAVAFVVAEVPYRILWDAVAGAAPTIVLNRCAPTCTKLADLSGGLGVIGSSVTASVPLSLLGVAPGESVSGISVTTSFSGPLVSTSGDAMALPALALAAPRVELGVAAPGTAAADVVFDRTADLVDGRFTADLGALGPGAHDVWARACLDTECGSAWTAA